MELRIESNDKFLLYNNERKVTKMIYQFRDLYWVPYKHTHYNTLYASQISQLSVLWVRLGCAKLRDRLVWQTLTLRWRRRQQVLRSWFDARFSSLSFFFIFLLFLDHLLYISFLLPLLWKRSSFLILILIVLIFLYIHIIRGWK